MAGSAAAFQLTPRLAEAASYVRAGKCVVDIGTDHAYLPIWLIQSGRCPRAIATDLKEGPLARASNNAYRYRVQTKLSLRLCDGLQGVQPEEADDIVIAGMGGELIAQILDRAPWVKHSSKNLILQAMSSAEDLRKYLRENGFAIKKETAVRDSGHVYTVINAGYTGVPEPERAGMDYVGKLDLEHSPEAREYVQRQLRHLNNRLLGQQYRRNAEETAHIQQNIDALRAMLNGGSAE